VFVPPVALLKIRPLAPPTYLLTPHAEYGNDGIETPKITEDVLEPYT